MSYRVPPPRLPAGRPMTRAEADAWTDWAIQQTRFVGGITAGSPLQVIQDRAGAHFTINENALAGDLVANYLGTYTITNQTITNLTINSLTYNYTAITLTGNQSITVSGGVGKLVFNPASTLTVNNLVGGVNGQVLYLSNVSSQQVILSNNNSSGGQPFLWANGEDFTLWPKTGLVIEYDTVLNAWTALVQSLKAGTVDGCIYLQAGSNITITSAGGGAATIAATGGYSPTTTGAKFGYIMQNVGGNGESYIGLTQSSFTSNGTTSNQADARGTWFAFATAATTNSDGGLTGGATLVQTQLDPILTWIVEFPNSTDFGSGNNSRVWIGVVDTPATLVTQDTLNNLNGLAFRLSSGTSDTKWQIAVNNGAASAPAVVDSGVTVAANTKYVLVIDASNPASVVFKINGTVAATVTTNLPAVGTNLLALMNNRTLANATKNFYLGLFRVDVTN